MFFGELSTFIRRVGNADLSVVSRVVILSIDKFFKKTFEKLS